MTRFHALHAKFLAWNTAHDQCGQKALVGMINLFNGLRVHLGAPEDAIYLCRVNPNLDGPDKYTRETATNAILQVDDNMWRFGIGIIFGSSGGIKMLETGGLRVSTPLRASSYLFFDVTMEVHEDGFTFLNTLDGSSPRAFCKFDDPASKLSAFYNYLAGLLEHLFDTKPWASPKKIPIGFESTRQGPP